MTVRIRVPVGRPIRRKQGKNRHVASAAAALLGPAALMAYVLGFWRIAAEIGFAAKFPPAGFPSNWQLWIPVAAALHCASAVLDRYVRRGNFVEPKSLTVNPEQNGRFAHLVR